MAKKSSLAWRVNDIVIASVLSVACGLIFWFWSVAIYPLAKTIFATVPEYMPIIGGGWLIAGVLGGIVIRKPGAALYCELLGAIIEGILGTHFGMSVIISGLIQGLGAELIFAVFLYRQWNIMVAALAGAVSGFGMGVSEIIIYYANELSFAKMLVYTACGTISGALLAGVLSWFLMKALAQTGVLSSLASGRSKRARA
ncbi:ECF transporter S component [Rothia sp. P7208]|uniref:ECF transporter S component n=1 Tax=Rothia sp. P7208 TaxID=3402660 RepID=UPI003ABE6315